MGAGPLPPPPLDLPLTCLIPGKLQVAKTMVNVSNTNLPEDTAAVGAEGQCVRKRISAAKTSAIEIKIVFENRKL